MKDDMASRRLFAPYSYACILAGMGYLPTHPLPILQYVNSAVIDDAFAEIEERNMMICSQLPSHKEYLRTLHTHESAYRLGP
jgi:hypothetical protein